MLGEPQLFIDVPSVHLSRQDAARVISRGNGSIPIRLAQ